MGREKKAGGETQKKGQVRTFCLLARLRNECVKVACYKAN